MKMRHEEVSQILLSPQFAHDLGECQFGKNTLSLQTQRQEWIVYLGSVCTQEGWVSIIHRRHRCDLISLSRFVAGVHVGTAHGEPGATPASAANRPCQQQGKALPQRQRLDPPVEARCPPSGDGTLLCFAQLPGTLDSGAADGLIGLNLLGDR